LFNCLGVHTGWLAGSQVSGLFLSLGLSLEGDGVGVVDEPVKDGVPDLQAIADGTTLLRGQRAGHDAGALYLVLGKNPLIDKSVPKLPTGKLGYGNIVPDA
jgi:hypothetical protein